MPSFEEERTWLLPRRAVFELKKLLENEADEAIVIGVCGSQLVFSGQHYNFFTRLLADPFPQYTQALDSAGFLPATLERGEFIRSLRRSASLLSGQFLATRFSFQPTVLRISLENKEVGSLDEQIQLSNFDGEEVSMRFYAPYLLHGVQVFDDEHLQLFLKGSMRPIIFRSTPSQGGIDLTYLVMPVVQG
jgi:DNA polymerase-3 subunit beta